MGIGFTGCIHGDSGLHLGVDHDMRMRADMESYFPREPGEWHLGDLGYVGADGILYPPKRPTHNAQEHWDIDSEFMSHIIAFYRSRVENVIAQVKAHAWARTPFRGRFENMTLYYNIALCLTALQIKHQFLTSNLSRFEVVGPWRHLF